MGESQRTAPAKVAALLERLEQANKQLYLLTAEVAIFRIISGEIDQPLYQSIMSKLNGQEFRDLTDFFNKVGEAARTRMAELDAAEEKMAREALAAQRAELVAETTNSAPLEPTPFSPNLPIVQVAPQVVDPVLGVPNPVVKPTDMAAVTMTGWDQALPGSGPST